MEDPIILDTRGHRVYNTKGGQVVINASSFLLGSITQAPVWGIAYALFTAKSNGS